MFVSMAFLICCAAPLAAQQIEWPCDVRTTERVVAIGDVHGAYEPFARVLRAAGVIDQRARWVGGRMLLVQTGDILDRGPDSRKVIDLLRKLERDAERAGGRVIALLGNHELMRILGDWRYVSAGEFKAFQNGESTDLRDRAFEKLATDAAARAKSEDRPFDRAAFREQFLKEAPLGALEMRFAFEASADYGMWVRNRATVAKVNGILFVHGGISPEMVDLGCSGLNETVRKEMASLPQPPERVAGFVATSESGPLWYRGLALEAEATVGPFVDSMLQRLNARAIVVGHTTVLPGRLSVRLGGKVVQIDAGMVGGEFYPGGVPAALEIRGNVLTALYLDRKDVIPTPALEFAPTADR